MTNATTQHPLQVSNVGTAGPYLRIPLTQLDDIKQLLDSKHIHYWVAEHAISLDDGPYFIIINFGRGADAAAIQSVLGGAV